MRPRLLFSGAARPALPRSLVLSALSVLLAAAAAACDRPPSADSLKEWTQADHHSSDDDKLGAGAGAVTGGTGQVGRPAVGAAAGGDVAQLVDITWRQQCTTCHGPTGRGDGQMGPMVQAPDLTRADWQSKVSDVEMAATIKSGRNRMPSFSLPAPVLSGLVARIRSLQAR
jgi:mono/diheme cytochrome c family protein